MKKALKDYFEKVIEKDPALKKVYSEEKLDGAIKYITDNARKEIGGSSGFIKDELVYKWARDYMLGDIAETTPVKKSAPIKAEAPKVLIKQNKTSSEDLPGQGLFDF